MIKKDLRDLLGGLLMIAIGGFAVIYGQRYEMGQLQQMGPGYFPVVLGSILALLGVFIAVPALFRTGTAIEVQWKSLFWVSASLILFAGLLNIVGVIFATMICVLTSSMASTLPWRKKLILAASIALLTYLIFSLGLGMQFPLWPWSR
ncbi:tripartite tricarboxylate transporter TctB family protein [Orrella daihaiensis]|uniref:Tripartite tricarboxylate transporter TctB family protein n=1 Tax=Orrella daihaiensis TaxID=2782176 RepID=A0ABY4AKR3_9BURK|nr:tripartite tricarboxylate transporter TctB family protein [Orrella daihaiensis]UOD50000.1 tripartite tricarboxylate transporter TctB family protein [Orrella daihaiensis]